MDEFHEFATTSHWRPVWTKVLELLTPRQVQILFLSGSVPYGYESRLLHDLGFLIDIPMIRSPVRQINHRYIHLRLPDGVKVPDFLGRLRRHLNMAFMTKEDQGIIFYSAIGELKAAAGDNPRCVSWADSPSKDQHERLWLKGAEQFMHATTTCILGLDNPRCNVVIFVNFKPGLGNILQGGARGGRKGQPTLVIFVTSHGHRYRDDNVLAGDPECVEPGTQMLNSKKVCLRQYFERAFNGTNDTCETIPMVLTCQGCVPNDPVFEGLANLLKRPLVSENAPGPSRPRQSTAHGVPQRRPDNHPPPRFRAVPYDRNKGAVTTIDIQPAMVEARRAEFIQKLDRISELSKSLVGQCGACWSFTKRLFTDGHPPFGPCSLERPEPTNASNDGEFRAWRPNFKDHTVCFECYMPQVKGPDNAQHLYNSTRTPHPVPGRGQCTQPNLFKSIAWAVFKTPDLLTRFNKDQARAQRPTLYPESTVDEFAAWAAHETEGMVNLGYLVDWLIRS